MSLTITTTRGKIKNLTSITKESVSLTPTTPTAKNRQYSVVLISSGPGNPADKHLYSQACINNSAPAFEGKPCYIDHPDAIEQQILPERSIVDIAGYFSSVHPEGNALCAILTLTNTPAGDFMAAFIDDCIAYSQKFPGQNLGGLSINGDGTETPVQFQGDTWMQVDLITSAVSVDGVSLPARGGEFLTSIKESYRVFKEAVNVAVSSKNVLTELRDKIVTAMNTNPDPLLKDLRRLADNALTLVGSGNQPTDNKENNKMALNESKRKEAEAEANAAHAKAAEAHSKLAEYHKAAGAEAEASGDVAGAAMHKLDAAKQAANADAATKMSNGEAEKVTSPEGVTVATTADPAAVDPAAAVDGDGDVDPTADPADAPAAEVKKVESLRKQVIALNKKIVDSYLDKKLSESGLPSFYHASIRESVADKTEADIDKVVDSRINEFNLTRTALRETGVPQRITTGNSTVLSGAEADARKAGL